MTCVLEEGDGKGRRLHGWQCTVLGRARVLEQAVVRYHQRD